MSNFSSPIMTKHRNIGEKHKYEQFQVKHELSKEQSCLNEIFKHKCSCVPNAPGGCFRKNFESVDGGNMGRLLLLFREQTRCLNKEDKDTFARQLFHNHCINCETVIDSTGSANLSLFGNSMLTRI